MLFAPFLLFESPLTPYIAPAVIITIYASYRLPFALLASSEAEAPPDDEGASTEAGDVCDDVPGRDPPAERDERTHRDR